MKKNPTTKGRGGLYVSLGLLAASFIYLFSQHSNSAQAAIVGTKNIPAATQVAAAAVGAPSGTYVNGSYTGSVADAYYGVVQVKAIVQGGKLTDVQFLQLPDTHMNSVFINSHAMPLLTQEALQVQSAAVDGVSGATFTSEAFKQSLTAALVQARG